MKGKRKKKGMGTGLWTEKRTDCKSRLEKGGKRHKEAIERERIEEGNGVKKGEVSIGIKREEKRWGKEDGGKKRKERMGYR